MTVIVTGFHPAGWDQYGRRMVSSWLRHWPENFRLVVYHEGLPQSDMVALPSRIELRSPPPDCAAFQKRWAKDAEAAGRRPKPGFPWKAKDKRRGYCFRYDAVKFSKMAFYAADAAARLDSGTLVWLDGDVITFRDVPAGLIDHLLDGNDVAYLGRDPYHPDAAFTAFRDRGLAVARAWGGMYADDSVFRLPEWHSAFVLRHAIGEAATGGVRARDLTPGGKKHVFFQCEVGDYLDHLKGSRRKAQGYSEERKSVAES